MEPDAIDLRDQLAAAEEAMTTALDLLDRERVRRMRTTAIAWTLVALNVLLSWLAWGRVCP